MKTIFTASLLMFSFLGFSQDFETINKMVSVTQITEVNDLAKKITSEFKNTLTYFKTKEYKRDETEIYQNVYFFPSTEIIKDNLPTDDQKELVVKVNFGQNSIGENIDLGVKGKNNFFFREVTGDYLDLVNFWIKTFYPNNTKEEILDNYKLQEFRVNKDVKFNFERQSKRWRIYRSY